MALVVTGLALFGRVASAQQSRDSVLTLPQAIALAANQGLSAQAATSALDAARWRSRAFRARLLPQFGLAAGIPSYRRAFGPVTQPDGTTELKRLSDMQSQLDLTMSQQLPWTGGTLSVRSALTRFDTDAGSSPRLWQSSPVRVGLQQDILRPNSVAWDRREQDIQIDVAERQYVEAREDVALGTVSAFFDVFSARTSLANAASNVAVNDTLYTLNKGRFEVGKLGENDLLQSELALLRARNSLDEARLNHERALAALRLQLGMPTSTPIAIAAPTDVPVVDADTTRAVAEALHNRRQMRDLELQAVQARRRLTEARYNNGLSARVSAYAGLDQSGTAFDDAYRAPLNSQQVTFSVEMPFLQWGAHKADVEAARSEQARVASASRLTQEQIAQEAHFAALQLSLARRQLELSAKSDTVAAKRFEVAKNRYVIGKIDIGNLYIAQGEKDQAVQAYVQALRGYWMAYYRLRRSTLYDFTTNAQIR